MESMKRGETLD